MYRSGADAPTGCGPEVRRRDDEEKNEEPEHASSTAGAVREVR